MERFCCCVDSCFKDAATMYTNTRSCTSAKMESWDSELSNGIIMTCLYRQVIYVYRWKALILTEEDTWHNQNACTPDFGLAESLCLFINMNQYQGRCNHVQIHVRVPLFKWKLGFWGFQRYNYDMPILSGLRPLGLEKLENAMQKQAEWIAWHKNPNNIDLLISPGQIWSICKKILNDFSDKPVTGLIRTKVCRIHVCTQVFQCTLMKCGPGVIIGKTINLNWKLRRSHVTRMHHHRYFCRFGFSFFKVNLQSKHTYTGVLSISRRSVNKGYE